MDRQTTSRACLPTLAAKQSTGATQLLQPTTRGHWSILDPKLAQPDPSTRVKMMQSARFQLAVLESTVSDNATSTSFILDSAWLVLELLRLCIHRSHVHAMLSDSHTSMRAISKGDVASAGQEMGGI